MDATLPARREFLELARSTLVRFNADLAQFDAPTARTDERIGLKFALDDIEFTLVHSTDPQIDGLALVTCVLGPLPMHDERRACELLLATNHELSAIHLTGVALDIDGNAIYTHSCLMRAWAGEGIATLIKGMAALATRWRGQQLLGIDQSIPLAGGERPDAFLAFA